MYSFIADTHTHTLACNHAYSTLNENARAAAQKGLACLCYTEHGPGFPGGADALFFSNFKALPPDIDGVKLICGIEVDILNMDGALGAEELLLKRLKWVIASMHELVISPKSKAENTECLVRLAAHPHIHAFGHIDNASYPLDYTAVIKAMAANGKVVELNNNSLKNRPGARENSREILRLCQSCKARIVVCSDAHHSSRIGDFSEATKLLEEEAFPQELILNADISRWNAYMNRC